MIINVDKNNGENITKRNMKKYIKIILCLRSINAVNNFAQFAVNIVIRILVSTLYSSYVHRI